MASRRLVTAAQIQYGGAVEAYDRLSFTLPPCRSLFLTLPLTSTLQIALLDASKGMERGMVLTGPNIFKYRHVRFSEDDKV